MLLAPSNTVGLIKIIEIKYLMNLPHLPTSANFHQDIILHIQVVHQLLQKSEAFQSVHHVIFILCYNVLSDFFALIRVRKHWWDDITQGKQ